jgi:hypothetical protein
MAKEIKTFPNIPVSNWINLRKQFIRSIPGTVTTTYLASVIGITEASARANIIPSLRMINLIDENGNTNQELARKFRDDSLYSEFCQEVISKNYPQEVRDVFPDKNIDREKVKSWFMNYSGVGSSAAQRIVAFYILLLEADPNFEVSLTTKKPTSKKKQEDVTITSKKEEKKQMEKDKKKDLLSSQDDIKIPFKKSLPDLNVNIQIHISSDATPDQIEKIFEAMAKHIYQNNKT